MATAIGLGIVLFFGAVIWSIKRHRDPLLRVDFDGSIRQVVPSLAGLTLGSACEGNAVEIIENGSFFDALLGEIDSAKRSVHLETFLWKEGALGDRLAKALAGRARAGVTVRVLLDANGCRRMGKDAERRLLDSGCELAKFHPWRPWNIGVFDERDHRKITVVDGRVAFVGGHCIVDEWLGNAEDERHYGDLSVRVRGPIVNVIQGAFSENWVGETGKVFVGDDVFSAAGACGRRHDPCRIREAGELGAGGEDPPPCRDLLCQEAHMDPESLLHPGARRHRRDGGGGRPRGSTSGC
jgi:cardiolipin synthase